LRDAAEPIEGSSLASRLADDLAGRPTLTRLLAVLHNVIEQNVEVMPAQNFVDWLRERSLSVGRLLEERCTGFGPGDGAVFLRRLAVVVTGLRQTASPSGIFSALLLDEAFAPFDVGLREELESLIKRILPARP
jgi:hypothetical protein